MRLSSEVNQYVSDQAPWALVKTDRDRAGTVLYVALRAVDSLKVIFTPFLPHTSQRLHELLGYDGWLAGPLEFRAVTEEDGRAHEVLTGDYKSWIGRWAPRGFPGRPLPEPKTLFRKLDPSIADDELKVCTGQALATAPSDARMGLSLYRGATIDDPVEGMFSFVPARRADQADPRFNRPSVRLPGRINPASRQSTWGSKRPLSRDAIRSAWGSIREQVLAHDLMLATQIRIPPNWDDLVPATGRQPS